MQAYPTKEDQSMHDETDVAIVGAGPYALALAAHLRARGAEVTTVPVYQWALPLDLAPLKAAIHRLAGGEFDAILLTTSIQMQHLLRVAAEAGRETLLDVRFRATLRISR